MSAGSSYLPSEMNAAYLWAQLEQADKINQERLNNWKLYYELLKPVAEQGKIQLPCIPDECEHNGHMFYIKARDLEERTKLITYLKNNEVMAVFHYIPLHSSPAGKKLGVFSGKDVYTSVESEKLMRLPMYYGLGTEQVKHICKLICDFYGAGSWQQRKE